MKWGVLFKIFLILPSFQVGLLSAGISENFIPSRKCITQNRGHPKFFFRMEYWGQIKTHLGGQDTPETTLP